MLTSFELYFVIENARKKVEDHGWKLDVQRDCIYLDRKGRRTKFLDFESLYHWICGYEFGEAEGWTIGYNRGSKTPNVMVKHRRKKV